MHKAVRAWPDSEWLSDGDRGGGSQELRQLLAMAAPAPEAGADLGSTVRLSPVRATARQQSALGSAKVGIMSLSYSRRSRCRLRSGSPFAQCMLKRRSGPRQLHVGTWLWNDCPRCAIPS